MKFFAFALGAALIPLTSMAATPPPLSSLFTSQNAVYSLTLSKLRTHDITGATGRLQFQAVDGCSGWATYQHITLIIRNADGSLTKSVSDYRTWESKDAKSLTFNVSQTDENGKMQVVDAGVATHTGADNSGIVEFSVPAGKTLTLPAGTLFPMQHTEALLEAGRDHKTFISPLLFDGTTASGVTPTFITIFSHQPAEKTPWPDLNRYASTNVSIAFFPEENQDSTPDFSTSMRYFENGVTTDVALDFGDFVMNGKLASLSIPSSDCPVPGK